jgi:hypothetical protein
MGWQARTAVIFAFLLAIHMFSFPLVVYPFLEDKGPSWIGLDPSWQMTLNYARLHGWSFGKDIIFTYGPLGFLSTHYGLGISRWVFVCFDLFVIVNFYFIFRDFLLKTTDLFLGILTLLMIVLLPGSFYGSGLSWIMLLFVGYWLYRTYENPTWKSFGFLLFLVTLSFFIKMNTGLLGMIFLCLHLLNLAFFKKINWLKAAIILVTQFVLLWICSIFLQVSLPGYVKGTMEIISGYNDVMYLEQKHPGIEGNILLVFYGALAFLAVYGFVLFKSKKTPALFFVVFAFGFLFLLKKQSMVRNDVQHLKEFFSYAPFFLLTGMLALLPLARQRIFTYAAFFTALVCLLFNLEGKTLGDLVSGRFANHAKYLEAFSDYNQHPDFYQANKRYIPTVVLQKIGNQSIDDFPWDGAYLLENKLHYTPRPVFQSYTAYTEYLEKKNLAFYQDSPPSFVLYDYDGIDGRYGFNEESLVNLFISGNYFVADSFTSNERWRLLLQKKPLVTPLNFVPSKTETKNSVDIINIDSTVFLKINLAYNLRGRAKAFLSKPSPVYISYFKEDGSSQTFKTSVALLKTGLVVDRFVSTTKDFANYLSGKNQLPRIVRIQLQLDPDFFEGRMRVVFFRDK